MDEFDDLSPRELFFAIQAKMEFEKQIYEANVRLTYESSRYQVVQIVNHFLPRKDQYKKVTEVGEFEWEKKTEKQKQSPEEMKKIFYAIAKAYTKRVDPEIHKDRPPASLQKKNKK
jgi:uncharacterized protein YqeY